jgi:hypothetical protein
MAQIDDSVPVWSDCLIEYSEDGVTWEECSPVMTALEVTGGERLTGEVLTFNADSHVLGTGARQPVTINGRVVFQNNGLSFWQTLNDAYEDNSDFWLRWFPNGGAEGDIGHQTNEGRIIAQPLAAQGEASNASPLTCEFSLRTDEVNTAVRAAS